MSLSGSGKSTLIRHVNRLIDPTAGEVLVGGTDVVTMTRPELQAFRGVGTSMVFQKFALLPHRTVLDNTVYRLEVRGVDWGRSVDLAMRWLERVGLRGFEKKYPNQLSGGHSRIIRVMPNLPVMVGAGMSLGCVQPDTVDGTALHLVETLFGAIGRFDWAADEEEFEQMVLAAAKAGLPAGHADRLVRQTFLGSARMLAEDARSAAEMKRAVTSPNGTTQAGLTAWRRRAPCLRSCPKR